MVGLLTRGPYRRSDPMERFLAKVDVRDDGCWVWTGALVNGYGRFQTGGSRRHGGAVALAHRWLYEQTIGPVPEGLELDHLCRVRSCVNPTHLEPVTTRENQLRGDTLGARNAAKSHCPKGHPYEGANLGSHRGRRRCLTCHAAAERERKRLRKEAVA